MSQVAKPVRVTDRVCWGMGWISSTLNVPIPSAQVPGYLFRDLSRQHDNESHHTPFHPFTATPTPRQNDTDAIENGTASTWRGAGVQGTPEVFSFLFVYTNLIDYLRS